MRREPTGPDRPAGPSLVVDLGTDRALRQRIINRRYRIADPHGTILVNDDAAEIEIAEAAWRILQQTGGLIDRPAIAARFGLSRQRTYQMTNNKSFPAPVGELGPGRPIWLTLHVERYRAHAQPGRPRGASRRDTPRRS